MDAVELGEWIHKHRLRMGLTQEGLGARVGKGASYISTLERATPHSQSGGVIRPSEKLMESFSVVFGVRLDEARRMAGYSPLSPVDSVSAFARQIDPILNQAPDSKRGAIEHSLVEIAQRMVEIAAA